MHEVNINLSLNYFILFVKSAESQYVTTLYEMVFSDDQSFIVDAVVGGHYSEIFDYLKYF